MNATTRCYRPGEQITGIHFFVLNKGYNSGKPAHTPWVNSYVITCKTDQERQRLYYLCHALWITGSFREFLRGSVIEFIVKHDFIHCLERAERKTHDCADQFTQCLEMLTAIDNKIVRMKYEITVHQRLQYETLRCLLA